MNNVVELTDDIKELNEFISNFYESHPQTKDTNNEYDWKYVEKRDKMFKILIEKLKEI